MDQFRTCDVQIRGFIYLYSGFCATHMQVIYAVMMIYCNALHRFNGENICLFSFCCNFFVKFLLLYDIKWWNSLVFYKFLLKCFLSIKILNTVAYFLLHYHSSLRRYSINKHSLSTEGHVMEGPGYYFTHISTQNNFAFSTLE